MEKTQTKTDLDIMDLRRLMDKIDMDHHNKFERLVQQHEDELGELNEKVDSEHLQLCCVVLCLVDPLQFTIIFSLYCR